MNSTKIGLLAWASFFAAAALPSPAPGYKDEAAEEQHNEKPLGVYPDWELPEAKRIQEVRRASLSTLNEEMFQVAYTATHSRAKGAMDIFLPEDSLGVYPGWVSSEAKRLAEIQRVGFPALLDAPSTMLLGLVSRAHTEYSRPMYLPLASDGQVVWGGSIIIAFLVDRDTFERISLHEHEGDRVAVAYASSDGKMLIAMGGRQGGNQIWLDRGWRALTGGNLAAFAGGTVGASLRTIGLVAETVSFGFAGKGLSDLGRKIQMETSEWGTPAYERAVKAPRERDFHSTGMLALAARAGGTIGTLLLLAYPFLAILRRLSRHPMSSLTSDDVQKMTEEELDAATHDLGKGLPIELRKEAISEVLDNMHKPAEERGAEKDSGEPGSCTR